MHRAITRTPRNKLELTWKNAVTRIIDDIKFSVETFHIIVAHAVYYNSNTKEFFPIFDAGYLGGYLVKKTLQIIRTGLIIDDLFDSFSYLRQAGKLFASSGLLTFYIDYARVTRKDVKKPREFARVRDDPKAHLSWIQYCVNSLLKWRSQEIILSQSIAKQLQSEFLLWGMKQDLDVLLKWLSDREARVFYISHPISEPRRIFQKEKKWPKIVDVINSIQIECKKQSLFTLMPTAIDEYRFDKLNNGKYTTKLTPRWPLPKAVSKLLLDYGIINSDVDHKNILTPQIIEGNENRLSETGKIQKISKKDEDFIQGVLTALELAIHEEIGNRDHHLVWLTSGIIVIDPYSVREDKIHGGVKKELHYLRAVNQEIKKQYEGNEAAIKKESRRLLAVFLKSTIEEMVRMQEFQEEWIRKLMDIVTPDYPSLNKYSKIFDKHGRLLASGSSLGPLDIDPTVRVELDDKLPNYRKRALILEFISRSLSMDESNLDYIDILIVDNFKSLTEKQTIIRIKSFLMDSNNDLTWQDSFLNITKKAGIDYNN